MLATRPDFHFHFQNVSTIRALMLKIQLLLFPNTQNLVQVCVCLPSPTTHNISTFCVDIFVLVTTCKYIEQEPFVPTFKSAGRMWAAQQLIRLFISVTDTGKQRFVPIQKHYIAYWTFFRSLYYVFTTFRCLIFKISQNFGNSFFLHNTHLNSAKLCCKMVKKDE